MKKFNKTLAIAFFAAVSAFSFQSASAATSAGMDSEPEACILLASETNNDVSFAKCIGPEWSEVDKLIADNPKRVSIVLFGAELFNRGKDGTLTEELKQFYTGMLNALGCPEFIIYLLTYPA